ncbi:MAG: pentapeptide repeat-containing protein, partial [Chloroflexi bacterium]|nr:pentapeptide repeat-containing protein [Chloroflexota bacterium]
MQRPRFFLADLGRADFRGATIDLDESPIPESVSLAGRDLSAVRIGSQAHASLGRDFSGANLAAASLTAVDLTGANFSGATVEGIYLYDVTC